MRGIKYFNLDMLPKLREGNGVSIKEKLYDLNHISSWYEHFSEEDVNELLHKKRSIDILIPFHNSPSLSGLIQNLVEKQNIPKEFKINITIVASACTSEYLTNARTLAQKYGKQNISIIVIEQPLPGKPLALNTGLAHINNEIVLQLVDDIIPSENTVSLLYASLSIFKNYGASVIVGKPFNLDGLNTLQRVQKIHYEKFYKNEEHSLVGRAFAFRKSMVGKGFPISIMSEDYWLELQVKEKSNGFLVCDNAYVVYTKAETWNDYLKQIDRYDGSFKQLKNVYKDLFIKHFGIIKNSFKNMLGASQNENTLVALLKFLADNRYKTIPKIIYLFIVIYQLYYLQFKNSLFPIKTAVFKRERSTLDVTGTYE